MHIPKIIVPVLLFISLTSFAEDRKILDTSQTAYQKLLTVKEFAFGGVGVAGVTSQGELAFRAVLTSPNALELFKSALSTGTNECKLYALCGIRKLEPRSFDNYSQALIQANPAVTTIGGCIIAPQEARSLIKSISAGHYDRYISRSRS
jgi:hypothetical protein